MDNGILDLLKRPTGWEGREIIYTPGQTLLDPYAIQVHVQLKRNRSTCWKGGKRKYTSEQILLDSYAMQF